MKDYLSVIGKARQYFRDMPHLDWGVHVVPMLHTALLLAKMPEGVRIKRMKDNWLIEADFQENKGADGKKYWSPRQRESSRFFREAAQKLLWKMGLLDKEITTDDETSALPSHPSD